MENTENKIPNSENQDTQNSSFFSESISSSNGLEPFPKLRFLEFKNTYKKIKLNKAVERIQRKDPTSEAPVMMLSAASGFIMQSEKYSRENAGQSLKKYILLKKGELAYNHGASKYKPFGCCFELKEEEARIPYVYHCFAVKENNDKSYIARLLNNQKIDQQLKRLISSSVRMDGLLNISYEEYTGIDLYLPSLPEQQKIAAFLSLVDVRIEKQRKLVENLKKYKRGLFFEIFEQKRRFKDGNNKFYPKWEKKSLGTIFKERTERAIGNEELLSVTINSGVKKRCEVDVKDNSSDDKSKYKKLYPNDIAYNTMRMWQGASGVSLYEGIVSPAYTVITPIIPVKIGFFGYYFKYIKTIQIFQKFSQGLTSDTWNLKYPQLSEIQLLIPNIEEQEKIYETFKFLDDKILLSENTLNLLQDIKKGLLQKMFI